MDPAGVLERFLVSLEKVVGAKAARNLLDAYNKVQLFEQTAQDDNQHQAICEISRDLESVVDDLQAMSLMHDLYSKSEQLLEKLTELAEKIA